LVKEIFMQNANSKHPEKNDPVLSEIPVNDSQDSGEENMGQSTQADKSAPSQTGGSQNKNSGDADGGVNKFLTNEKKKYGGKPPGDESIANRGVTKPSGDKDKTI